MRRAKGAIEIRERQRPRRLPVVLTSAGVGALSAELRGVSWIMAMLLYGSGPACWSAWGCG